MILLLYFFYSFSKIFKPATSQDEIFVNVAQKVIDKYVIWFYTWSPIGVYIGVHFYIIVC